jgi:hypothetical protein
MPTTAAREVLVCTHWTRCLYCDSIWPRPRRSRPRLTSGLALVALYVVLHLAVGGVIEGVHYLGARVAATHGLLARLPDAGAAATH